MEKIFVTKIQTISGENDFGLNSEALNIRRVPTKVNDTSERSGSRT